MDPEVCCLSSNEVGVALTLQSAKKLLFKLSRSLSNSVNTASNEGSSPTGGIDDKSSI
jgi:hypothetical protein